MKINEINTITQKYGFNVVEFNSTNDRTLKIIDRTIFFDKYSEKDTTDLKSGGVRVIKLQLQGLDSQTIANIFNMLKQSIQHESPSLIPLKFVVDDFDSDCPFVYVLGKEVATLNRHKEDGDPRAAQDGDFSSTQSDQVQMAGL